MRASVSKSSPAEKAPRPRPTWEKWLVRGGIVLLLLLVAFEWNSRRQFEATLAGLEAAIGSNREPDALSGISIDEIDLQIKGSPTRTEKAHSPSPAGPNQQSSRRWLIFRWPSLFKTYLLRVSIDGTERAILVESVESADLEEQGSPLSLKDRPPELPARGLSRADRHIVELGTEEPAVNLRPFGFGSLGRELIRQSVLIAARDELGLATGDASIGEVALVSESPPAFPLQVNLRIEPTPAAPEDVHVRVVLTRAERSGKSFTWSSSPFRIRDPRGLVGIVEQLEALSRTEVPNGLKEAGYEKAPAPASASEPAAEVAERGLDFVSQFAVVQRLHAVCRTEGETAENLGGLVRAYANLGSLIEFHWSPASKGYKARSLLYAQRLLSKFGASKSAFAHRAYALALAGSHAKASEALQEALATDGPPAPAWFKLIRAFCEYDVETLAATTGPQKELALYLKMQMIDPDFDRLNCVQAIRDFAEVNPDCTVIPDLMCETREIGLVREATELVVDRMWPRIHAQIAALPGLPSGARDLSNGQMDRFDPPSERRDRVRLIESLRESTPANGLRGEPSWSALADLIAEVTVVQCWRVIDVEKYWLGLPTEQSIAALSPLIKGHPLEGFLNCYADNQGAAIAAVKTLVPKLQPLRMEIPSAPFAVFTYSISSEYFTEAHKQHVGHWDLLFNDLVRMRRTDSPDLQEASAARLTEVSPAQPRAIVASIDQNWEAVSANAEEWERKYATNAAALAALGKKYRELYRSDDAIRCLEKSIAVRPEHYVFSALASEYRDRGEKEKCRETYERATQLESFGLEQSQAHVEIARLLMSEGNFEEAKPHALAAAETYSAGGLSVAAQCAEGLKEWRVAEAYERAMAERYEGQADQWYFWCVRTGRGSVEQARDYADDTIWSKIAPPFNYGQLASRALDEIITGDWNKAISTLTTDAGNLQDVYTLLLASLLADKLGDSTKRDAAYEQIERRFDPAYPLPTLVHLFRAALRTPDSIVWDHHAFDELVEYASNDDVAFLYYCGGSFLQAHGKEALAREYLECAATTMNRSKWGCLLASHELRQRKIDIGPQRLHSRPDSWFPAYESLHLGYRAEREKKFDVARACFDEGIRLNPEFTSAWIERARLSEYEGKYVAAIDDYEAILQYFPDCERAHLGLAYLRAGCDQAEFRNGAEALRHATIAYEGRVRKAPFSYAVMAAAHAELGDFDKAVELQSEALKLAPKDEPFRQLMQQYQEKKPYRYPAKSESPAG